MSGFPSTPAEFGELSLQGRTVIVTETESEQASPGDGWVFWSYRRTANEDKAVWRKIATLEEAEQWQREQDQSAP